MHKRSRSCLKLSTCNNVRWTFVETIQCRNRNSFQCRTERCEIGEWNAINKYSSMPCITERTDHTPQEMENSKWSLSVRQTKGARMVAMHLVEKRIKPYKCHFEINFQPIYCCPHRVWHGNASFLDLSRLLPADEKGNSEKNANSKKIEFKIKRVSFRCVFLLQKR